MSVLQRNNVRIRGSGPVDMVFAHGYGCDQNMWRFIVPAFEDRYRTIAFDHVGAGLSDVAAYDVAKYASLDGYARDLIEVCEAVGVRDGVFVGHSVSAMIGVVAARMAPSLFGKLILIGPSPRYIDDGDYRGGFSQAEIDELLAFLDSNHLGWSTAMAPVIMGNGDRPELAEELTNSFCRTDPEIAKRFARATFLADNRADLASIAVPTLILQCADDVIAPQYVGDYVHAHVADSVLLRLAASGHCPNLSAPAETVAAMSHFLEGHA